MDDQTATDEELQHIQAQLQLEISKAELEELRRRQGQQTRLAEVGQQIGDQFGYLFDDPRFRQDPRTFIGWQPTLHDRLEGRFRPFFDTEEDLARIRGDGRLIGTENPAGEGVLGILKDYVLGTGFEHSVSPKQRRGDEPGRNQRLAEFTEEVLEEFDSREDWPELESEHLGRAIEDGESFLKLTPIGGGRAEAEIHEPESITKPTSPRGMSDFVGETFLEWDFGIATAPNRLDRPLMYFVDLTGDQSDWDVVPVDRMCHYKRNTPRNIKRGMSDFFPVAADHLRPGGANCKPTKN